MTATSETDMDGRAALMGADAQTQFQEELSRLRTTSGLAGRDKVIRLLGGLMALAGLIVILLCYSGAISASDLRDQLELLILALFGLGLMLSGLAVFVVTATQRFLRFWLLRLVYEQRDLAGDRR